MNVFNIAFRFFLLTFLVLFVASQQMSADPTNIELFKLLLTAVIGSAMVVTIILKTIIDNWFSVIILEGLKENSKNNQEGSS
jgi:hypothetical protein